MLLGSPRALLGVVALFILLLCLFSIRTSPVRHAYDLVEGVRAARKAAGEIDWDANNPKSWQTGWQGAQVGSERWLALYPDFVHGPTPRPVSAGVGGVLPACAYSARRIGLRSCSRRGRRDISSTCQRRR